MALLTCPTRIPAAAGIMHAELHLSAIVACEVHVRTREKDRQTVRRSGIKAYCYTGTACFGRVYMYTTA